MSEALNDMSLRPAFGSTRGMAAGMQRYASLHPCSEDISALPPAHLRHIHRAERLQRIWNTVLGLMREPVEVELLSNGAEAIHILGCAVLVRADSGLFTTYVWEMEEIDRPYLEWVDPRTVALAGLPSRSYWLQRLMRLAAVEIRLELKLFRVTVDSVHMAEYLQWMYALVQGLIRRHTDMRQVRRRVAKALKLDRDALRRAHYGLSTGLPAMKVATVDLYNSALEMEDDLNELEEDAPHFLPLFMAVGQRTDFPFNGEPVSRLKRLLKSQGFTEKDWRFICKCDRRLLLPMRDFYRGGFPDQEALDYLRILCALDLDAQPPADLVKCLFGLWGNPARRHTEYHSVYKKRSFYPHIVSLAIKRHAEVATDVFESEFVDIVGWAMATQLCLTKNQKRAGWKWLLLHAQVHHQRAQITQHSAITTWAVPVQTVEVGDISMRFLESSVDLWDEAKAMSNCVDRYVNDSRDTNVRLASITRAGKRIATAMYLWEDGGLRLIQVSAKANRLVSEDFRRRLERLPIPHVPRPPGVPVEPPVQVVVEAPIA